MSGRQRSMAVRHYEALYGPPAPLTAREVVRSAAALALAAILIITPIRAALRLGEEPGPSADDIEMQPTLPEVTR